MPSNGAQYSRNSRFNLKRQVHERKKNESKQTSSTWAPFFSLHFCRLFIFYFSFADSSHFQFSISNFASQNSLLGSQIASYLSPFAFSPFRLLHGTSGEPNER